MSKARLLLVGVVALSPALAQATPRPGVYAVLTRAPQVTSAAAGDTLRLEGAFQVWTEAGAFAPPACGYMYFRCPAGRAADCTMMWRDISNAAAANKCAVFGSTVDDANRAQSNGRVRPLAEAASAPDEYRTGLGVQAFACAERGALEAALAGAGCPIAAVVDAGADTAAAGTGGAAAGTGGAPAGTGGAAAGTGGSASTTGGAAVTPPNNPGSGGAGPSAPSGGGKGCSYPGGPASGAGGTLLFAAVLALGRWRRRRISEGAVRRV